MRLKAIPFICIFLLFFSSLALAQEVGNFVGTVADTEDNPLPGVTITAKNVQTGLTQSTISNARGRYRIDRIMRGTYNITASLQGFKTLIKEGIILYAGGENKIDFKLEIGKLEEEITVVGETPMVETTKSQVSTVMTNKEILSYPQANRNFLNLMAYAPGTMPNAPTTMGKGFAINGMRGESNNFMLDGINNNDMTDNSVEYGVAVLPPEAIQEFRLVTNNFNVESARNTGGQLNVVMKSGTNELHGSAWLFYRGPSALFRSADWLTHERLDYSRQQYGATIGGPIIKDKTFFFASFEGVKQKLATVRNPFLFTSEARASAVGVAKYVLDKYGSSYPTPTYDFMDVDGDRVPDYGRANFTTTDDLTGYIASIKIDHIFSSKDRISFRWLLNYQKQAAGWPYYWGVPGKQVVTPKDTHTGGLTWLHLFSPTAYNEVRVGYHREDMKEDPMDPEMPYWAFYDQVTGFGDGGYHSAQHNQTYQLTDVMNFQVGNHSIKLGGELRYWRVHSMLDMTVMGQYVYYTGMDFIRGNSPAYLFIGCEPPKPPADNPYVKGSDDGEWKTGYDLTWRKWRGIEAGVFAQDDWRVSNRLTVSLGLRWDYYSVPAEVSGEGNNQPAFGTRQGYETGQVIEGTYNAEGIRYLIFGGRKLLGEGLWNPYYGCFAPKVSFAYDLTGDGKTSVRGGYGIGYERQMNRSFENDRFNYPAFAGVQFIGSPMDPSFPDIVPTIPGSIPPLANRVGFRSSLRWMDPELKPQMAHNWLLGIQRELAPNVSIEVNYTGSAGRRIGSLTATNRYTGDGVDGIYEGINPYAGIRDVYMRENKWKSNYHSVQVILNKRFSNGWSWYTSYTYGHSQDYISGYQYGPLSSIEREDMDYGNADYDYRHRMVGGFVYDLPFFKQSKSWFMKNVLAGWQLAASFSVTSGQPFSVAGYYPWTDYNKDGIRSDWPLWLGGSNSDALKWDNGMPYFDGSQFGTPNPPANGYYDEATMKVVNDLSYYNQNFVKRNQFNWFSSSNIDIALQKYFTIPVGGREVTLQFIAEVFNLMKSQIWELPVLNYALSNFGEVTRMNGERTAQISLRVMF